MGYIGKLTAQEAERLLELIEKLQQKGDVSGDGSDNCCIIDLENFSAEKYKEAYDFTQNGKFLLIKPSKESIFISTYNSVERQKGNKKYFISELESIIYQDNGPGNRGLEVYRIDVTFYNDGTFEVDDSYNIFFNKEGDGKKFLSNDGTYKEIESGSNCIILDQYKLDVGQTTDKNKELYNTLYDSRNDIPVYWRDDKGDAYTYSLIPCAINYINNSSEDYFKITQLNMGYSESQDNEGKPKGVFLVMGMCYRVHSNGYCDMGEGIDNRNFEENLNKFIGLTLPFEGAGGDGTKFLSDDYTYKEINASSIYAINTEEDLNYNKIKEALDNGKLISIPMLGLSICNTFIDEDNNINILMDKIPTEASFFLNLSKATHIKISPNNEINMASAEEEPLFNAMTINIPFVFKDIHNRTTTVVTNDTTDVNYSLDLYQNPPLIFRYEESKGHYGGYRYIIPVYQNMLNNDYQSQWVLNAKCIINTKDGLYLAEIIIDRSKNNKNITYEIIWIRPLFDNNPNTIILSFASDGETMDDDQYALLVDSCDNNKKLKVDFVGDNIVTLDAYAIQRMTDNTITFHIHEISYADTSQNSYNETIMTWIVKPDKSIKLLYRETSLS